LLLLACSCDQFFALQRREMANQTARFYKAVYIKIHWITQSGIWVSKYHLAWLNKDGVAEMVRAIKAACALKNQELENSRLVHEHCGCAGYDRGDTSRMNSYGVNTFRGLNKRCTLNQIAVASAFEIKESIRV
jgi:hypothetical protein